MSNILLPWKEHNNQYYTRNKYGNDIKNNLIVQVYQVVNGQWRIYMFPDTFDQITFIDPIMSLNVETYATKEAAMAAADDFLVKMEYKLISEDKLAILV
jgi:hypothetical protein